jgi:hypothetical protein
MVWTGSGIICSLFFKTDKTFSGNSEDMEALSHGSFWNAMGFQSTTLEHSRRITSKSLDGRTLWAFVPKPRALDWKYPFE